MDFSFSFMQGIMGNTIQQPPQLIDSANIRQEDAFDASSDIAEDGGQTPYEAALQLCLSTSSYKYGINCTKALQKVIPVFPVSEITNQQTTQKPHFHIDLFKNYLFSGAG